MVPTSTVLVNKVAQDLNNKGVNPDSKMIISGMPTVLPPNSKSPRCPPSSYQRLLEHTHTPLRHHTARVLEYNGCLTFRALLRLCMYSVATGGDRGMR